MRMRLLASSSRLMSRRPSVHSSLYSASTAPTRRMRACAAEKIPTPSVRRRISLLLLQKEALVLNLSRVGGPHHEHGARRLPEEAFRGAADEHVVQRAVVVPAHDDRRGINV